MAVRAHGLLVSETRIGTGRVQCVTEDASH